MADYSQQKVPDLKKILQERGLAISGNKADLIARLQEDDSKKATGTTGGEDEIDWDEDDTKATTEPAAAAVAAGGQGQVPNPVAVPNQKVDTDPSTTKDLKVEAAGATKTETATVTEATSTEAAAKPEEPKQDFSIGIKQTDAEKEAEKRAQRAKRFGITVDDEEKKLVERAKKFGLDTKETIVKGLDSALPERRLKRAREDKPQGGRNAKRQTPDRRTEPRTKAPATAGGAPAPAPAKKASGRITDDPSEKAKAEARAKRFASAA